MKTVLKLASFLGLGLTVVPAFLVFAGTITWTTHATMMALGAVLWFVTAPFWIPRDAPV